MPTHTQLFLQAQVGQFYDPIGILCYVQHPAMWQSTLSIVKFQANHTSFQAQSCHSTTWFNPAIYTVTQIALFLLDACILILHIMSYDGMESWCFIIWTNICSGSYSFPLKCIPAFPLYGNFPGWQKKWEKMQSQRHGQKMYDLALVGVQVPG